MLYTVIYRPGNFFAYYRAHRAAYKVKIHTGDNQCLIVNFTYCGPDSIVKACFYITFLQPVSIIFIVAEF